MTTPATGIRASDAEREQIAKLLQAAAGEGRLTPEEAGERLAQASAARYRHDLTALIADLPALPRDIRRPRRMAGAFWIVGGLLRTAAFVALMLLFWRIAFWPMVVFGIFAFAVTRAVRFGWYARRRWWMRHGPPARWVTGVR